MSKTILAGLFAILAGIIVLFVTVLIKRSSKDRQDREELETLINSIILEETTNLSILDLKLGDLREFFLRNEKLRKEKEAFFGKWLPSTLMSSQLGIMTTGSHWTKEKVAELIKDLHNIAM